MVNIYKFTKIELLRSEKIWQDKMGIFPLFWKGCRAANLSIWILVIAFKDLPANFNYRRKGENFLTLSTTPKQFRWQITSSMKNEPDSRILKSNKQQLGSQSAQPSTAGVNGTKSNLILILILFIFLYISLCLPFCYFEIVVYIKWILLTNKAKQQIDLEHQLTISDDLWL